MVGNRTVPASSILNVVRTREGEPFDPATVEEDFQRVFGLRKFANVEARVEPTASGGVIVVFDVVEQRTITEVRYIGNTRIATSRLQELVDISEGETIDRFRIALARQAIERAYREKNHPFTHIEVDEALLTQSGILVFNVVEGPNVRIRRVAFRGTPTFPKGRLLRQVKTRSWIFIFRPGRLDFEQVEDDVASLRRFYESKGFFDARTGRRIVFSPDQTEAMVEFVVDEGTRYTVDNIRFEGLNALTTEAVRSDLRLTEGMWYDQDLVDRDIRRIVKAYSPYGFIYQPPGTGNVNPEYLQVTTRTVFRPEAGKVELVYEINEGRPFRIGQIIVKGNSRTQDKLVLRELRVAPGQLYDSSELTDAVQRLRSSAYFSNATVTPVGDKEDERDLLVEVQERQTASFNIGAGVNSNGGVGGNITFEQRNFDASAVPRTPGDFFTDRAFTGAGQRFRVSIEPGTQFNSASVLFSEPWLFDQPYSFTGEAYFRDRIRSDYDETRAGGRVSFGHRFDYENSVLLTLRGEDVNIHDIEDPAIRADEIVDLRGHSQLTSVALQYRRDTTPPGFLPDRGSTFTITTEQAGALGGNFSFNKLSAGYDVYFALAEDLLERPTVLTIRNDAGYIFGEAPFFERYYGGGIGSIRGFQFRGVSPRAGLDDDAIGGDFVFLTSAELNYPIASDFLRGVVFVDAGTVESDFEINDFRSAVGFGFRLTLPIFGGAPFALDFALPLTSNGLDEEQVVSFSFGLSP